VNGRPVLAGDGIQVAKAGRKMPGVEKLHRQSESNTKPEYIFGHSCQATAVLTQALSSVFALRWSRFGFQRRRRLSRTHKLPWNKTGRAKLIG
jgi:hypothetical protein